MLREGSYPWELKKRIMSTHGHLSNDDAGMVLSDVLSGNNEIVVLAHLSQDNNLPELAYNTVRLSIISQGIDVDNDVRLNLSFRDRATCIYSL
jgi:phosphoribosyl 1,2-cyclic phosphodiesterase